MGTKRNGKRSDGTVRGTLRAFNISPKGQIEGALVESGEGTVQVNFPKHGAEGLVRTLRVGAAVELAADREDDDGGEHPVFALREAAGEVSGTVARLNYARHGEVNGYVLDDGTFVHCKPGGAKKHKLAVGDRIEATGERRQGADAVVIEAEAVKRLARAAGGAAQTVRARTQR